MSPRRRILLALLLLAAIGAGIWLARPAPPAVIFVVLDTVRADHLSLCGYERPTSPPRASRRGRGAAWTCEAIAPGSWTVPSHASFFTGLTVTEHGVHTFGGAEPSDEGWVPSALTQGVFPLPRNRETLAEALGARGYQSYAVSANPLVSQNLGLTRGFTLARSIRSFEDAHGALLAVEVEGALRQARPDRGPLLLFVNIADAHVPWRGVPEGLDWAPPRDRLTYAPAEREGAWSRYVRGELDPAEAEALRAHARDAYDYAVWEADQALGRVLTLVEEAGWLRGDWRLIVTSDHGELLGEHGLLAHGYNVYEPNARVPLLYLSSDGHRPELSGPINALHAFHLARDGALPPERAPVQAVAFPSPTWAKWSDGRFAASPEAALWDGGDKLTWRGGARLRYDLSADPGERAPRPGGDHPQRAALDELLQQMRRSSAREGEMEDAAFELLRAAGYVE